MPTLAAAIAGPPARFPSWHTHADVWLLLGGLALLYGWAARATPPTPKQAAQFAGGLLALVVASDWPVHDLAEGYLYSVHMVQHLLFSLVAPPLLILGLPRPTLDRLLGHGVRRAIVRRLTRPVMALLLFNAVIVASHWPVWVDATLRHHPLHFAAHAILLIAGFIMWMPVVSPLDDMPQLHPLAKMLYLFLQSIVPTVPASFLTFGTTPLYHYYEHVPRLWGFSALTDQQVAGVIMKVIGGLYLWLVIVVVFFRWYAREEEGSGKIGADPDVLTWDQVERELNQLS
jgi:putative membrane protein